MAISERRRLTFTAVAVAVVGVVTGLILGGALFSGDAVQISPSLEAAEKVYAATCAVCHGQNREGLTNLGPELTRQSLTDLSDTEILDTISDGRDATAMQAWKGTLTEAEIDGLVQFVRSAAP